MIVTNRSNILANSLRVSWRVSVSDGIKQAKNISKVKLWMIGSKVPVLSIIVPGKSIIAANFIVGKKRIKGHLTSKMGRRSMSVIGLKISGKAPGFAGIIKPGKRHRAIF